MVDRLAGQVDALISISEHTLLQFERWCTPRSASTFMIPPAVDLARFYPGPASSTLLERYNLAGRTVLLTVARLSAAEQNWKGIDDVLLALPRLAEDFPDVSYLIVGGGDDAERLKSKVAALGVESDTDNFVPSWHGAVPRAVEGNQQVVPVRLRPAVRHEC